MSAMRGRSLPLSIQKIFYFAEKGIFLLLGTGFGPLESPCLPPFLEYSLIAPMNLRFQHQMRRQEVIEVVTNSRLKMQSQ